MARNDERSKVCTNKNFIIHKEKDKNIMASYIYGWIGEKVGTTLKEREKVQTRGKTDHLCQNAVAFYQ